MILVPQFCCLHPNTSRQKHTLDFTCLIISCINAYPFFWFVYAHCFRTSPHLHPCFLTPFYCVTSASPASFPLFLSSSWPIPGPSYVTLLGFLSLDFSPDFSFLSTRWFSVLIFLFFFFVLFQFFVSRCFSKSPSEACVKTSSGFHTKLCFYHWGLPDTSVWRCWLPLHSVTLGCLAPPQPSAVLYPWGNTAFPEKAFKVLLQTHSLKDHRWFLCRRGSPNFLWLWKEEAKYKVTRALTAL